MTRTGRRVRLEEYRALGELKLELLEGKVFGSDEKALELLELLIEQVGLDAVVKLAPRELWMEALTPNAELHVLRSGEPLCGFMLGELPGDWPDGHRWISEAQAAKPGAPPITCSTCAELFASRDLEQVRVRK